MPETRQKPGYVETTYGPLDSFFGSTKDVDLDVNLEACGVGRQLAATRVARPGEIFDRVYPDGTRKIGYKHADLRESKFDLTDYIRRTGWVFNPAEELIWTIRPDGSATYTRSLVPLNVNGSLVGPNAMAPCQSPSGGWTPAKGPPGTQTATYSFSPEGLALFRKVASLYPNGFVDRSRYNEFPVWPQWLFPFDKNDSVEITNWIKGMEPAEVLALYYTLLEYSGPSQGIYGESYVCRTRKPSEIVSPQEFISNGFWSPFQEMLIRAIWDIRTDLRKVKDPVTGNVIDGIIDYRLFTMPCSRGSRGAIAGAVTSIALAAITLGASSALQGAITVIGMAKDVMAARNAAQRAAAMQDFASKVVIGYSAAADKSNIIKPLEDRANGVQKQETPPQAVVPPATGSSITPWIVAAAAAAIALS